MQNLKLNNISNQESMEEIFIILEELGIDSMETRALVFTLYLYFDNEADVITWFNFLLNISMEDYYHDVKAIQTPFTVIYPSHGLPQILVYDDASELEYVTGDLTQNLDKPVDLIPTSSRILRKRLMKVVYTIVIKYRTVLDALISDEIINVTDLNISDIVVQLMSNQGIAILSGFQEDHFRFIDDLDKSYLDTLSLIAEFTGFVKHA